MKRHLLLFAALLAVGHQARADSWSHGFGQGIREASVESGEGDRITVNCESGFDRPVTGVLFTLDGQDASPNSVVTLVFDADAPVDVTVDEKGELSSNCPECATTFERIRDKLRSGHAVQVRFANGAEARFSLKGARNAIGNACVADYRKTYPPAE